MATESIDQKIKRLSKEYQESVTTLSKAEGVLESDIKRLKTEFGHSSTSVAQTAYEKMNTEIQKSEKELKELLDEIDQALEEEG